MIVLCVFVAKCRKIGSFPKLCKFAQFLTTWHIILGQKNGSKRNFRTLTFLKTRQNFGLNIKFVEWSQRWIFFYLILKTTYFFMRFFQHFWLWLKVVTNCDSDLGPVAQIIKDMGVLNLFTRFQPKILSFGNFIQYFLSVVLMLYMHDLGTNMN